MMNPLVQRLVSVEKALSAERGPFDIFALFSTDEGLEDKWDIVVSATWISDDNNKALHYMSFELQKLLTPSEFLTIAKIAILDVSDPRVKELQSLYVVEHGLVRLTEFKFSGSRVDIVYLITCKIQVEVPILKLMWPIIVKLWKSGDKAIKSEKILTRLEEQGLTVPDYALDRILDYLKASGCIRGPQFIGRDAIKRHGAMVITFVDRECFVPELYEHPPQG